MLSLYWQFHPYSVVIFLAVGVSIALLNYFSIRRLDEFPSAEDVLRVSVLIPARDEEANIRACVESLLAQEYPNFEILVLDDNSADGTRLILENMAQNQPRLQIFPGQPLPPGWLGKHWACHQLSQKAGGELLLFTDADTLHAPNVLRDGVSAMLAQKADLLTAFPREEIRTWGEKLTVPILSFSIFCFFPIPLAAKFRIPFLSVTIGQFMLFRRAAFEAVGGYEAIRDQPVDDVMLGRNIIRGGLNWQFADATRHVACRMYRNFPNALEGFTKNLFAFFGHHILLYCLGWFWIAVAFILPFCVLLSPQIRLALNFPLHLAVIAVFEALLMFGLAYHRFRLPILLAFLYPFSLIVFAAIAFRSLAYSLLGFGSWKGRELPPPAFKL